MGLSASFAKKPGQTKSGFSPPTHSSFLITPKNPKHQNPEAEHDQRDAATFLLTPLIAVCLPLDSGLGLLGLFGGSLLRPSFPVLLRFFLFLLLPGLSGGLFLRPSFPALLRSSLLLLLR